MPPKRNASASSSEGLNEEQRRAICLRYRDNPHLKLNEIASWVKEEFHATVHVSTISRTLKRSEELLTEMELDAPLAKRRRDP